MADKNYRSHSTEGRQDPYDALRSAFDDPVDMEKYHTRQVPPVRSDAAKKRQSDATVKRPAARYGIKRRTAPSGSKKSCPFTGAADCS